MWLIKLEMRKEREEKEGTEGKREVRNRRIYGWADG